MDLDLAQDVDVHGRELRQQVPEDEGNRDAHHVGPVLAREAEELLPRTHLSFPSMRHLVQVHAPWSATHAHIPDHCKRSTSGLQVAIPTPPFCHSLLPPFLLPHLYLSSLSLSSPVPHSFTTPPPAITESCR